MSPNVGEVWEARGLNEQKAYYLTLELVDVNMPSSGTVVPHWMCLCLDSGRVGLTSLDMTDTAVAWSRVS